MIISDILSLFGKVLSSVEPAASILLRLAWEPQKTGCFSRRSEAIPQGPSAFEVEEFIQVPLPVDFSDAQPENGMSYESLLINIDTVDSRMYIFACVHVCHCTTCR